MNISIGFLPQKNRSKKVKSKKQKELIVEKNFTHSCAIGQTGCGKTTGYIYPNLNQRIKDGDGILFFDYKGKEHNAVKFIAESNGRLGDVVEIGKDWGESINLLKYMSEANLEDFFKNLLGLSDGKNDYWGMAGTNISVSILKIIDAYSKFIKVVKKNENSKLLLEKCFYDDSVEKCDYLKEIPTSKSLESLLTVVTSVETVKKFFINIKNLVPTIKDGLNYVVYNLDEDLSENQIRENYKDIIVELCVLDDVIVKYSKSLDSFTNGNSRNNSTTPQSILLAVNKTINLLANKKFLNEDSFDIVKSLNRNKIIIINTQELSEEVLTFFSASVFTELMKRTSLGVENSISIFIDEAQRVLSKEYELPIDVLREAKVELFLAYQNSELMIEKLGKNKYHSLYKNFANRFLFKNNEKYLDNLKTNQYYKLEKLKNIKPFKAKPYYIDKEDLFNAELIYQKSIKLLQKYEINDKKFSEMILVHNSHLMSQNKIMLKDLNGKTTIVNKKLKIDEYKFDSIISYICENSDYTVPKDCLEDEVLSLFEKKLEKYKFD